MNIEVEPMAAFAPLADLCKELDNFEYERIGMDAARYEAVKEQVKEHGRQAAASAGRLGVDSVLLMRMACDEAAAFYPNTPNTLTRAWDGIGGWES